MMNNFYCMLVGVHDSYWTHACDVDKMNRLLREKFVELYETPVLENVWFKCSLFIQCYCSHLFKSYLWWNWLR